MKILKLLLTNSSCDFKIIKYILIIIKILLIKYGMYL